jgi:hypothetical protein
LKHATKPSHQNSSNPYAFLIHPQSTAQIERSAVAEATQITYPQTELLQLMHEHLNCLGLHAAAAALAEEARLVFGPRDTAGRLASPERERMPRSSKVRAQAHTDAWGEPGALLSLRGCSSAAGCLLA